jgi:hypothetical protein
LILELNRAKEIVPYLIGQIQELVAAFRWLFAPAFTQKRKTRQRRSLRR